MLTCSSLHYMCVCVDYLMRQNKALSANLALMMFCLDACLLAVCTLNCQAGLHLESQEGEGWHINCKIIEVEGWSVYHSSVCMCQQTKGLIYKRTHAFTHIPGFSLHHSASIEKYLLEKSRIVSQASEERNYHVFYYLLSGADSETKAELQLMDMDKYEYLTQVSSTNPIGRVCSCSWVCGHYVCKFCYSNKFLRNLTSPAYTYLCTLSYGIH